MASSSTPAPPRLHSFAEPLAAVPSRPRSRLQFCAIGFLFSVVLWLSAVIFGGLQALFEPFPLSVLCASFLASWLVSNYIGSEEIVRNQLLESEQRMRQAIQVAELRQTQRVLIERSADLEAALTVKNQFIAKISHEIRTPLSVIVYNCDPLRWRNQSAEQAEAVRAAISSNATHLLALFNDLLTLAKLTAGKSEIALSNVSLLSLVRESYTAFQTMADEKKLDLACTFAFPLPSIIHTDSVKVRQILTNLLDNAIKFTPKGSVKIHTEYLKATQRVSISVTDTGIGIPEEQRKLLFQMFSQGHTSSHRRFGGAGLGLAISQQLALLLGGEITVESSTATGSVFTLLLPTQAVPEEALIHDEKGPFYAPDGLESTPPGPTLFAGEVLVAEDCPETERYLRALLEQMGITVTSVVNGNEVLACTSQRKFDLILMDTQMPDMDGISAVIALRGRGVDTPILALSVDSRWATIKQCRNAGCDGFLSKPIQPTALTHKLRRYLEPHKDRVRSSKNGAVRPDFKQQQAEFISSFPTRMGELEQALVGKDFETLRRASHQLAGAAAFAFPTMYPALLEVHEAARGGVFEECASAMGKLREALAAASDPPQLPL